MKTFPWIGQKCSGLADTLTLTTTRLTPQHNLMQEFLDDGDMFMYSVVANGGIIKIEGIGVYNSAGPNFLRADRTSWNGTTYDSEAVSNIALPAGEHDLYVTPLSTTMHQTFGLSTDRYFLSPCHLHDQSNGGWAANTIHFTAFYPRCHDKFSTLGTVLDAGVAAQTIKIGVYNSKNGMPFGLPFAETGDLDASTPAVDVEAAISQFILSPRLYFTGIISTANGARPESGSQPIENLLGGDASRLNGTATIAYLTWAPTSYANAFLEAPPTLIGGYGKATTDRYPLAYAKK